MVNGKRMLAELMALARIPSPSRGEGALAGVVVGQLRALGLRPRRDRCHRAFGGETGTSTPSPRRRRGHGWRATTS